MIDILLVNPRETGGFFEKMPPLGLASIAANLEKNEYSVKIIDFEIDKQPLEYWLNLFHPRFLGISGTTHTRFESFRLAREAKTFDKTITVVYGGVHASCAAVNTLNKIPEIDFIVRGEGEETIVNMIKAYKTDLDFSVIRGLAYRGEGVIIDNPPAYRVDLNDLPMPAYHLLEMKRYALRMPFNNRKGISLITSRGCQARCSFCSASHMFNHLVTTRSAPLAVDEISRIFTTYGYEAVKIFDSTFTIDRDHALGFCREIMERGLKFPWECEIRVGSVDVELLERMRDAGCYYVDVGIESGSQKVLDLMRKGITVEQAHDTLELCHKVGLKTKAFFSYGHIGETMKDVDATFAFIEQHSAMIDMVASGAGVRIYPGTYLDTYARKNDLLPADFEWSLPYKDERLDSIFQAPSVPVLIQTQLGFAELEKIALRIYGNRYSGWEGFKLGLTKVTDPGKLRKLTQVMKLKLKDRFQKPDSDKT